LPDWIINQNNIPEEHQEWSWESGNYERFRKHISVALGNTDEQHPFDVELTRIPPGSKPCPVHAHGKRWEFFIVVSGSGHVYRNGEVVDVKGGDCFMQPGGTRHRIYNANDSEDLVYYVIANEVGQDTVDRFET
tara:strand:+ start:687 stop:1088 length:402 start_codon:yes stop_codon:yes gene_type:complete